MTSTIVHQPQKLGTEIERRQQLPQRKVELTPNEEQQQAINQFLKWFRDKNADPIFELDGKAGAGKSLTLSWMLKAADLRWLDVILAAPVNKAAFVLQQSLFACGLPRFECKTIHSALGISVSNYDENGSPIFDNTKGNPDKIKGLKLLIIDEKSINPHDLHHTILTLAPKGLKILFCGDSYQLPPVVKSAPLMMTKAGFDQGSFTDPFRLSPSIGCATPENTATLQKIMRQDGGAAVDCLASIRETIADADDFMADIYSDPNASWSFTPSLSVFEPSRDKSLKEYESRKALLEKAIELFSERKRCKLIAYKNSTVNSFQTQIFNRLFPGADTPYPIGAYIQLSKHWRNGGAKIIVPAGCEGYVVDSTLLTAYFGGERIEYYSLAVDFGDIFGTVCLKVPTDSAQVQVKLTLSILKSAIGRESGVEFTADYPLRAIYQNCNLEVEVSALANVTQAIGFSDSDIAREHGSTVMQAMQMGLLRIQHKPGWAFHHELGNSFAQIEHGYSSTFYRAQGSTYDEVLVCNDMPRFTISPWQWDRNAIDLVKVKAQLSQAFFNVKLKRGQDAESFAELAYALAGKWLGLDRFAGEAELKAWMTIVFTALDSALEQDHQYLAAYTRATRGMEPRLCLRALYVAASRHKATLHFFDSSSGYD